MPSLAITGGLPVRILPLRVGVMTVGRSSEADLELPHAEISRQHCRITWDEKECRVEDLGSRSGTRINGELISSITRLLPGDVLGLGQVTLRLDIGAPQGPAAGTGMGSPTGQAPENGQPIRRILLKDGLLLGRDSHCDVRLNDPTVSRRHCQITSEPDRGWLVHDLQSGSGSFVNGRRFDQHALILGDRLQVGPFCFQFDGLFLNRIDNASGGALDAESVGTRAGGQNILAGVSLHIAPSQFIGILGPSGAGKSTLLHVLAGLRQPDTGSVFVDGRNVYHPESRPSFGFVPQDDIVHPELTVTEAFRFAAQLRLAKHTPQAELEKLLSQTLEQLGLQERAHTPVARLSGGQRKRVSVGVELLAKPSVLFLDEPTSGLDPGTEFQLMELLRHLADTGCTVICTTHVMENAYLMDQIVVLMQGGLVFKGTPKEARERFDVPKLQRLYDKLLSRTAADWRRDHPSEPLPPRKKPAPLPPHSTRPAALPILLRRQWTILRADPRNFVILLGQPLLIGALVSWVTDERSLVMFFAYLATLWFGCSNAAQELVKERPVFIRERLVGVGPHPYLGSKLFFLSAITLLQAALLYGATLLGEGSQDGSMGWQAAALGGTALAAVGIGTAISAYARTVLQAVMVVPLLLIPQIVFSGYTVPASDMTPAVARVSRCMPSFSAQTMMDTSFLWKKQLQGNTISDHAQSYRNLDPERELTSRDTFERSGPALRALLCLLLWTLVSYWASWIALRRGTAR